MMFTQGDVLKSLLLYSAHFRIFYELDEIFGNMLGAVLFRSFEEFQEKLNSWEKSSEAESILKRKKNC